MFFLFISFNKGTDEKKISKNNLVVFSLQPVVQLITTFPVKPRFLAELFFEIFYLYTLQICKHNHHCLQRTTVYIHA